MLAILATCMVPSPCLELDPDDFVIDAPAFDACSSICFDNSLFGLARSNSGCMTSDAKTSFFCHKFRTRITRD